VRDKLEKHLLKPLSQELISGGNVQPLIIVPFRRSASRPRSDLLGPSAARRAPVSTKRGPRVGTRLVPDTPRLAALSLAAIDARLEGLLEGASKKEPSYADYLREVSRYRPQLYLKARLQLAQLPLPYLRAFRFRLSAIYRQAADPQAVHSALRARSFQRHPARSVWRLKT
jgi:hypothetical protein